MRLTRFTSNADRAGVGAAAGSLLLTLVTGVACVGPFVAILAGVSGLGHLTRYAHLRIPASLLTFTLLAGGFYWIYGGSKRCRNEAPRTLAARVLLWTSAALAVAVNVFEYVILQRIN